MDDKKTFLDLEEDEELASLRIAALQTIKTRPSKNEEPNPAPINTILAINSITRSTDYSSDHGSFKKQHSWCANNNSSRKRGRPFSKPYESFHRSNLIVITPVGGEDKDTQQRQNLKKTGKIATKLLLPQHKWLKQINEDSSSPKTDRHTGPTRFNRHGSDSESSESDYDDSDDSYSNETILQDEPSRFSRTDDNDSGAELKNNTSSELTLSFQSVESNSNYDYKKTEASPNYDYTKTETSSNYDYKMSETSPTSECEKTAYSKVENSNLSQMVSEPLFTKNSLENGDVNSSDCIVSVEEKSSPHLNIHHASKNSKSDAITHYKTLVDSNNSAVPKSKHTLIKFDVTDDKNTKNSSKFTLSVKKRSTDSLCVSKEKRHVESEYSSSKYKAASLSRNDLRFELKRKKEISGKSSSPSKQVKVSSDRDFSQNRSRKRSRARSWSRERSESRDRQHSKKSRSRKSSRSWSSSSSSSSSVSSSDSSPVISRSISSVVQPVQSKIVVSDTLNNVKSSISRKPLTSKDLEPLNVKTKSIAINLKSMSVMKISVPGNEQQNCATDIKKRGPVHMRLGNLSRKRIIQIPKSVEAAFVNTSSDEDTDVNIKCKKTNIVINDKCEKDTGFQRHSTKVFPARSDVPKFERGRALR